MSFESGLFLNRKQLRVLVAGYINLNVIDGSAFFLSGLSAMLAGNPNVSVVMVSANPITRYEVLDETLHFPNIEIIDPFAPEWRHILKLDDSAGPLTRRQFAALISKIAILKDVDSLIVRDTETCYELINEQPSLAPRLAAYLTGFTHVNQVPDPGLVTQVEKLGSAGVKLLCQTQDMKVAIQSALPVGQRERVKILPPQVPDPADSFENVFSGGGSALRFCYTGKFFKAWNTDKIFAAFKSVNTRRRSLTLAVAGDQFRESAEDPNFVKNTKYLLETTPGLQWHGRVPRSESRRLIVGSQVGIGWRSPELDASAELSTKILEYGVLGRPSILNRTPLHEELLGADYPLFANSMTEFKHLLARLADGDIDLRDPAKRCYDLGVLHSYSSIRPFLLEILGYFPKPGEEDITLPFGSDYHVQLSEDILSSNGRISVDGEWVLISSTLESDSTVREQLDSLKREEVAWNELLALLSRERQRFVDSTTVSVKDSRSYKRLDSRAHPPATADGDQLSAKERLDQAEAKISAISRKLEDTEARLGALRRSKLGRLQLQVWQARRGRHQLPQQPGTDQILGVLRRLAQRIK